MDELDKLVADVGEERVRRFLIVIGARDALRAADKRFARQLIARLRGQNVARRIIVRRIQLRFGFSQSACYALIAEHLKVSKITADFGKTSGTIEPESDGG